MKVILHQLIGSLSPSVPWVYKFYTSQEVVWDFFHQQHDWMKGWISVSCPGPRYRVQVKFLPQFGSALFMNAHAQNNHLTFGVKKRLGMLDMRYWYRGRQEKNNILVAGL